MSKEDTNAQPDMIGTIQPHEITTELRNSYLDYAMSVIVARALPDVRDGLKPVHRRILVTMNDLHLSAGAKHRKSAKIAGDVSGNYHPHGESNVYPALVRLAQDFSLRYPLVDGQGNFGSIDGDTAAAMRYTEARMTSMAELMLTDLEKETVNFIDNYDATRQEPVVLPAAVPQLLLNGTLGIAVGMASNIPPHNLGEVVDATVAVIDDPEIDLDGLLKYIPGPDFPTGAQIYGTNGIKEAYATGRGKVDMRGVAEIVEARSGRTDIIITEIPYLVNKSELVLKIADLVRNKKIDGIADIRDESDRKGMRIVIELKKTAYPKKVLNRIYEMTPLQSAYHINTVALVDGIEPRTLALKEVLSYFITHRVEVVTRRSKYDLARAEERAHILEGLLIALDNIDAVVETIRKSATREEAHKKLQEQFKLSAEQATAILDMRLATLVGLERNRLADELEEKRKLIEYLKGILADEKKLRGVIKDELLVIKEKFADKRRTKIIPQELSGFSAEDLIPNETVLVTLTKTNYIKRVPVSDYKSQGRGGKGVIGMSTKEQDQVLFTSIANTHDDLIFFTDQGRLFKTKVYELPAGSRQAKGSAVANVIQLAPDERVTSIITLDKKILTNDKLFFVMGTERGVIKKTAVMAYKNVRASGIRAVTLRDKDVMRWAHIARGDDMIVEVTAQGQAIVYHETDVRPMGRTAAGVRGVRLRSTDKVVSMVVIPKEQLDTAQLLLVLDNGFGKRTDVKHFPVQKRGGVGIKAANVTTRTGSVVESRYVLSTDDADVIITSKRGQVIKVPLQSVKKLGRVTQGVTLMRLNDDDMVAGVDLMYREDSEKENNPANE